MIEKIKSGSPAKFHIWCLQKIQLQAELGFEITPTAG